MTLLYIDDDDDDYKIFLEALSAVNRKIKCIRASDGKEGLKLLTSVKPDYIFLDVNMPIMDGREVLRKLRTDSRFADIPIVIFSTNISATEAERFRKDGANDCIIKPSSFSVLCNTLRSFLKPDLMILTIALLFVCVLLFPIVT